MGMNVESASKVVRDGEYTDLRPNPQVKDRFPRIVIVIILTEFCERFSYSGMRAFLTLYLRSKLGYSDDEAMEKYHIFSTFVYVFPIIGGIMADNYLGKFRTILYMMFVYAAGNILVAVTAIPQLALPGRLCTLIGLFMITIGTGGIKPCVTSFGGDQFELPRQENQLVLYFSLLYWLLCMGSLIAKTVSPILRSEVHCFGDKDCYSLAFGAPGLIVLASIVIFVSAKTHYVAKKPEENVILKFVKCVSLGIKNAVLNRGRNEKTSHWLDTTQHHYDKMFIKDIKKTLSILMLFTVLPVFWALLDQLGSRWTLQATKMDGRFGFVTVKPDQMQVLNPIFIIILIPVFQQYLYPWLERRNILTNPLHKLTVGGVLAGVAFIASGILEIYISSTYPDLPRAGFSQLRVYNGNPCSVSIENSQQNITYTMPSLSQYKRNIPVQEVSYLTLKLGGSCIEPRDEIIQLEEKEAISFYLRGDKVLRYRDNVDKSKSGFPFVSEHFFGQSGEIESDSSGKICHNWEFNFHGKSTGNGFVLSTLSAGNIAAYALTLDKRFLISTNTTSITLFNERRSEVESVVSEGVSTQIEVFTSTYSLRADNQTIMRNFELESGGVYAILVEEKENNYIANMFVITEPNSITMAWLLPQLFIISVGEVLFAVTGNEFAFKEAPNSMKAVMTSVWLLTEAFGNVIIIIVNRLFANFSQQTQFFIFTGMMFSSITVFHFLSRGYQMGHPEDATTKKGRSNSEQLYMQVKQAEDCLDH